VSVDTYDEQVRGGNPGYSPPPEWHQPLRYGLNVYVLLRFTCENFISKVMALGGAAFGRWLGHKGAALTHGLVPL
jgi:hypothetical protein